MIARDIPPGTHIIRIIASKRRAEIMLDAFSYREGTSSVQQEDGTWTVTIPDWPNATVSDLRLLVSDGSIEFADPAVKPAEWGTADYEGDYEQETPESMRDY